MLLISAALAQEAPVLNADSDLALIYTLPDPGQAAALAGVVGFGAGHFHARDGRAGVGFLVLDTILLAAPIIGFGVASDNYSLNEGGSYAGFEGQHAAVLSVTCGAGILGSRLVQLALAPKAARKRALAELSRD